MQQLGWLLVLLGAMIVLLGVILMVFPSIPWLGRLPGDIVLEGKNWRVYFPLATSLLLSVILSVLLSLWMRWFH